MNAAAIMRSPSHEYATRERTAEVGESFRSSLDRAGAGREHEATAPSDEDRQAGRAETPSTDAAQANDRSADDVAPPDASSDADADTLDATRAAQDLIAGAVKMFVAPTETAPATAPAVQAAAPIAAPSPASIDQAIHQLLDQIAAKPASEPAEAEDDGDEPVAVDVATTPDMAISVEPQARAAPAETPKGPTATVAVREPAPLPENPNPSHVHLVLDEGAERVVVTVAVRGTEVNAMIRGGDEQTGAAIARNAASLDHALRARGLDLSSFTAERDLDQSQREHPQQHESEEEVA